MTDTNNAANNATTVPEDKNQKKSYYVQLPGYAKGEVWDEDKYNRNKEALFREHPDVSVFERTSGDIGNDIADDEAFTVYRPGFDKGELWDGAKLKRNREKLYKDIPDIQVSRVKAVDYNAETLAETNSAIAERMKRMDEISHFDAEHAQAVATPTGGVQTVLPSETREEKKRIEGELTELYAKREANPAYQREQKAKAQFFDDENARYTAAMKELEESNPSAARAHRNKWMQATSQGRFVAYSKKGEYDPEYTRDIEALAAARNFMDEAKKTAFAPSKYDSTNGFANFFRGIYGVGADVLTAKQLMDAGLNMRLIDAVKKIRETEGTDKSLFDLISDPGKLSYLSDAEKELVRAFCIKAEVDASRAGDLSLGYQSGDSAFRSLGFMADFLATGGIGTAAGKAATKGLLKATAKMSAELGLEGATRTAALAVPKFAIGTLEAAVKTAVMSPLMPSTWVNIQDNLLQLNDAGTLNLGGDAIARAVGDAFIENLSENAGPQVEAMLGGAAKLAGKGANKLFHTTKFTDWAKIFDNSGTTRLLRDAAWNGYIGEIGEEWYGNALRVMTGVDPDALKNFATVDQQIITLTSFAPMSVFGGATSAAQYGLARKNVSESGDYLASVLRRNGYDEAQIKDILDVTKAENPTTLASHLAPVINQIANDDLTAGKEAYKAVMDYADAIAKYRVFDGIHDADVSAQRDKMYQELRSQMGDDADIVLRRHSWMDNRAYVTYDTVHAIEIDGKTAYIVGENEEERTVALQFEDGEKRIYNRGAVDALLEREDSGWKDNGEMRLDDYLDMRIAARKGAAEQNRMNSERSEQAAAIVASVNPGDQINIGTEEAPIMGTVVGKNGEKVILEVEGRYRELTPDEVGNALKKPISVKSDEDIERELIAREEQRERPVQFFRGKTGMRLQVVDESGDVLQITDAITNYAQPDSDSVQVKVNLGDGVYNWRIIPTKAVNAAIDEYERQHPAVTEAATEGTEGKSETESAGTESTDAEAKPAGPSVPTDFRGNPIPQKKDGTVDQTAFWNSDPEAWTKWNDEKRGDGGVNSMEYLKKAADKLKSDIKATQKKLDKETDFDRIDQLEQQKASLEERLKKLSDIQNGYRIQAAETARQKAEEDAAKAKAARDAQAAELEKYNTDSLESIKEKWEKAPKEVGSEDTFVLSSGEEISGHYVLTEAFAPTASHNTENGFAKTEGFPVDENGRTVNDRDYEHDKAAQQQVEEKAASYDQRALQTPVVVSQDGVVLSGNDRTMASQIAARQGTDTKYNEYLAKHSQKYGFTPEQVAGFKNPRVVFVPNSKMPYDAATFAKFNAEDKKTQSKTESAVKAGKVVPKETVERIAQIIDGHESIAETYADEKAVAAIIRELVDAGIIQKNEISKLMDGSLLSGTGEDLVESVILGAVLREDALRCVMEDKAMRRSIMSALTQLIKNNSYGEYSLMDEFSAAVVLLYQAKKSGLVKIDDKVANYLDQPVLEGFGENPVASATIRMLADIINSRKVNELKNIISLYNARAEMAATGQADLFLGDVESREQILTEIIAEYERRNNAGQQTAVSGGNEKAGSPEEQAPDAVRGETGSGEAGRAGGEGSNGEGGRGTLQPVDERRGNLHKGEVEVSNETYQLSDEIDENGRQFVLNNEGDIKFGEISDKTGLTPAPILLSEGVITNPSTNAGYGLIHIEARHGEEIRKAGYKSVVEFVEAVAKNYESIRKGNIRDGLQTYMLQLTDKHNHTLMVELSGDGTYWNVNTAGIFKKSYGANREEVYNRHTTVKQSAETVEASQDETQSGTYSSSRMNASTHSEGKDTQTSGKTSESTEKSQAETKNEGQFGLVSDGRMAELKKRLLEKIKGQLNSGFDPELLSIGMEMAAGYIDRGIKTFVDFSKAMIADFGDAIRPYLKAFYNGAREMPGMEQLSKEMDAYDSVSAVDVNSVGKEAKTPGEVQSEEGIAESGKPQTEAAATLGTVTKDKDTRDGSDLWVVKPAERVSNDEFKELKTKAKDNNGYWSSFKKGFLFRNEQDANKFNSIDNGREEQPAESGRDAGSVQIDDKRRTDTAAAVLEAGTVAGEVESLAQDEGRPDERRVSEAIAKVDKAVDKVNGELALLGYYEAEKNEKDYNEAYGYMRNAEKKAVKDAQSLAEKLAFDLGLEIKDKAKANIAPAGGDITFRLQLADGSDLYVDISISPNELGFFDRDGDYDDLGVRGIMYRVDKGSDYGQNYFLPVKVAYQEMLKDIRSRVSDKLPQQPITGDLLKNAEIVAEKSRKQKKTSGKKDKSEEKSAYLQDGNGLMGNLFADLDDTENVQTDSEETAPQAQPVEVEPAKQEDNGLQGVYGVRAEGMRSDDSGHESGPSEEHGESGEGIGQDGGRTDGQGTGSGIGENRDSGSRLGHPIEEATEFNSVESSATEAAEVSTPAPATEKAEKKAKKNTHNNSVARGVEYAPKAPAERFRANIEAIKLMKKLIEEERQASKSDMEILRKYTGWGGLGTFFNNGYSKEYRELTSILTAEELQSAEYSINTAYFTPSGIIDTLWDIAKRLGFEGGKILEGSAGIGNMLASMPKSMSEKSDISAVELDTLTGNMLKLLYPDADVQIKGFQDADIENNSVDLAITNVPFGTDISVYDSKEKDLTRKFGNRIHDFCIAKNIRKLREGGIGIFITTSGTLDKSRALRNWVVTEGNADFIGAFRLNNETFGGTPVTSDIIVVRKRVGGKKSPNAIDVNETTRTRSVEIKEKEVWNSKKREWETPTREVPMEYNSYFVQHPENMAGEMRFGQEAGDTFRPASTGLYPDAKKPQDKLLSKWAKQLQNSTKNEVSSREQQSEAAETESTDNVKEGQIIVNSKGEICLSQRGKAVPIETNSNKVKGYAKQQVIKDYDALKNATGKVLDYQTKNGDDKGLKPLLEELNRAYDEFTSKYGNLNKNAVLSFLRNDVDFPSIAAVEDYKEEVDSDGKKVVKVSKTDIFNKRVVGVNEEPHPKNVKDGVIVSINREGEINVPYIAKETGLSEEQVQEEVLASGLGFVDPATGKLEVRYNYLSGNVREKLEYAREHNPDGKYDGNIKALEKVIPADIPAHLINFTLGSDWIDGKFYTDYAKEKFGLNDNFTPVNVGGVWSISDMKFIGDNNEKNRAAGVMSEKTGNMTLGHELMLAAMNNTPVKFSKTVKHHDGTTETITDQEATNAAQAKIEDMRQDFCDWAKDKIMKDNELAKSTSDTYNRMFNAIAPKEIEDEFLPVRFPGATTQRTLYPHQKKAVIRGTTEPVLLAHEVGTGKSYTLISTAMELRRLGLAKKPMIVVQNATVGQFVGDAKLLYPNSKILTVSDADRTSAGRTAFYAKIKYNDWDMIVVPQSVFEMIPDSEERQRAFIQEKIDEKMHVIELAKQAGMDSRTISSMKKGLADLKSEYETGEAPGKRKKRDAKKEAKTKENAAAKAKQQLDRKTDDVENFDEMGIDALLIDEAHAYKHLGFSTQMQRGVKGVDPSYSKRSAGVYLKLQSIFDRVGRRNVVFATGTPISNTAAEIWTFMKYLVSPDVMRANHIYYFDDFVRNFGRIAQSTEFTTSGKYKETTRFSGYINLPELVRTWSSVADTVLSKDAKDAQGEDFKEKLPEIEGGKAQDIFLPQSPSLIGLMNFVREKLDKFDKMSGKEKREHSSIPLVMYGIAQRAAIDPRLVDSNAADEPLSKTNKAVEEILKDLKQTESYRGTCAVFCDNYRRLDATESGDKVEGFNLFKEMKRKLIEGGVPEDQIVIMESGMSVNKKQQIFDRVIDGDVRVIMGTTQTLGTGVNIQTRLHAVVHMDAPNRPMDYTQRNGRILRQGNLHKEWGKTVRIIRFGVEDSLDVTAYQRLKTKSEFIDAIMNGKPLLKNAMEGRTIEEPDEGLFDNAVAQLSGSQYALKVSAAEREIRKLNAQKQQHEQDQIYIEKQLRENESKISRFRDYIEDHKKTLATIADKFKSGKVAKVTVEGRTYSSEESLNEGLKEKVTKPIREYLEEGRKDYLFSEGKLSFNLSFDGVATTVNVIVRKTRDYVDGKGYVTRMSTEMAYDCPVLGVEDRKVAGNAIKEMVSDFRNEIATGKNATRSIEALQNSVERMEQDDALMRERRGKPFKDEEKLKEARAKLKEYQSLMKKEMEEKEAKYAQAQSSNADSKELNAEIDDLMDDEGNSEDVEFEFEDDEDYTPLESAPEKQLAFDAVSEMLNNAGVRTEILSDAEMEQLAESSMNDASLSQSRSPRARWLDSYVEAESRFLGKSKKEARAEILQKMADAKKEAKELYEDVLSGNFNAVTLQRINDYIDSATPRNIFYRPLSQRLPERALLSLPKGERTGSVDALFSRICESAVPANGRTRANGRREIEARKEELLEKWAKATGNWHESIADFTGNTEAFGSGTDSEVFLSDDGTKVIKASKGKFDNRKHPSDIDQVALFNSVFPGSAYRILGYGRLNGNFVRFLEQPFVDFSISKPLTTEERVTFMNGLGFAPLNEEKTLFTNDELVVSDLQKSNIVKDASGNIRVIDADVKLHTKDLGGNYTYPPVETDTDTAEFDSEANDKIEFLQNGSTVYGAAVGGKILLNAERLNPNTPIHEYTHLWDAACRQKNPELWKRGVELMKQTPLWDEIKNDPNYAGLDENGIAGEVHARLAGENGAETLERMSRETLEKNGEFIDKAARLSVIQKLRNWLSEFWYWIKNTMTPWSKDETDKVSIEDFVNMPLADLAKGTRLDESTNEDNIRFHIVTDKKEIDRLNSEPTIKVYRGMQLVDGKLYPPMSAKVNGEWREGIDVKDLGKVWEQADENPELADGKGNFKLDKGNKSSLKAKYNPYIHTSTTPLNDQFSSAQSRPELVTVEVEIPKSELTSGYKAEKAKDSVGKVEWKAGVIQSQLTGTRTVILSRWDKPMRIVPDSEVADVIVKMFGDKKITMPSNVVTPSLRAELEKRGIPFVETDNTGKPVTRFRDGSDGAYDKAVADGDMETAQKIVEAEAEKKMEKSVVRNEDGTLKKVYHGSRASGFTVFDKTKTDDGRSLFFTDNEDIAKGYVETEGEEGSEYSVYLDMRKPLVIDADGARWNGLNIAGVRWILEGTENPTLKKILDRINRQGATFDYINEASDVRYKFDYDSGRRTLYELFSDEEMEKIEDELDPMDIFDYLVPKLDKKGKCDIYTNTRTVSELAEDAGYDGVIFNNIIDGASEETTETVSNVYAVFDPSAVKSADAVTRDNEGNVIPPSERFNREDEDIRYREEGIEAINDRFDKELKMQAEGTLPGGHIYQLGRPSDVLLSTGIPNLPIELSATRLAEKSGQRNHMFDILDVAGLPKALWKPLVIFSYGDKTKSQNVIVGLKKDGKQFVVGIHFNQEHNGIQVNSIRGLFNKDNAEWLNWISQGKSLYLNKAEIQALIDQQRTNLADVEYLDLDSVTKVLNEFENPKVGANNESGEMMRDEEARPTSFPTEHSRSTAGKKLAAEETAKTIGVGFEYISRDELPEGHKGAKGMWRDGKIYICAENNADADDVKRTMLHEAVGHMGLRRLVGDKNMGDFCMQIYKMLPKSERAKIANAAAQKYGLNFEDATEEYLAEMAETFDLSEDYDTIWDRIRVVLHNAFAKIGINLPLSERDARWILWQSYNANRQGDLINQAKRQVLADRLGFSFRADNMRQHAAEGIRFRDMNNNAVTSAANLYNTFVSRASARLHEGYVDMFNSVNTLVDAIEKQTGRAAAAFEDIRLALNQQSSKALATIEHWERTYYNPLMETIKGIIKKSGLSSEEVDRYAFLKHGLERNVVLAKRDAKQYYEEKLRQKTRAIRMSSASQADKDAKKQKAKDEYDRHCQDVDAGTDSKYLKLRDNDYSGLTSLYSTFAPVSPRGKDESNEEYQARVLASRTPMYDNLKDVEDAARKEVADLEGKIGSAGVAELWKRTNAATKATLKHQYDSGMLTKEQYEHVRDMFQYYVPMRGFADNTAEDMYTYYASGRGGFTPPLQTAKGRKSQAASPWGYIGAMASSAVAADSKNEAKLTLYYFASNRPENDLVTISDVWYEKTGVDPATGKTVFTPAYPTFSDSLDKASAKAALDKWEQSMQAKAANGEAFKGTRKLDLKNSVIHIDKENSDSHVIRVKVNGQDKMMFINGNPRAAQAINNELNLDAVSGPITNGAQAFLRHMAAFNTSYNPEFWISNLQRDLLFSLMAVDVKEDAGYRNDFLRNLRRSVKVFKMLRANKNGKLGTSRIENTYREFVDNGGVTGFTVVKDNEEWEQTKREFLADKNKAVQGVANALGAIQDLGESIEQMTRFAAYLTSREHGKDIREAISDAKELTVNFNRKGSGKPISIAEARQLTDKDGKPLSKAQQCFYVLASSMSRVGRLCVMFFNAGVQGLNTMYQLWKKDHRKTAVWMAGYFTLGVINAVLHSLFDDDDDYLDMPEYERRNNALLGGNGYYFKWALPQESRVFYAMGDVLVNDMILGRNPQKKTRGVGDIVESVFDVMPVNPMNGWRGVMPEIARPLVEIAMNEDYKGEDVHRDSRWLSDEEKELTPKYKQAYDSTPKPYVYLSMAANWASGGDSLDSGFLNLYPEDIQHLVEGYSGGLGTFVNRLYGATVGAVDSGARSAAKGEGFAKGVMETTSARTTPFLNRLLIVNDERRRNAHTSEVFNYYKAQAEHTKRLIQEAKKSGDDKAIDKIFNDDERLNVYTFYEAYKKLDEAYFKLMRLTDDETERRQLMREQDEIRKEMIEEIAKENKK